MPLRHAIALASLLALAPAVLPASAGLGTAEAAKEPNLVSIAEIDVNAGGEHIQPYLVDLTRWVDWTTWNTERDPSATYTYGGEPGTVGHTMYWEGKKLGKGRLTLTEIKPDDGGLTYNLWFGGKAEAAAGDPSVGLLVVTEADGKSTVVWEDRFRMGFPWTLFKKSINKAIVADFSAGLAKLKVLAEADAAAAEAAAEQARAEAEAEAARAAAEAAEQAAKEAAEAAEEAADESAQD